MSILECPKRVHQRFKKIFFQGIDDPRVKYANLPESNHGGSILTMLCDKPEEYHYVVGSKIEDINKFIKNTKFQLEKGFYDLNFPIEIISGEDLFYLSELSVQKEGVKQLKEYLLRFFKTVKIVAYVRKPSQLLASAFQQLVKYHNLGTFSIHQIYHRYRNFESYINIFGIENVYLWNFNPKQFLEGDILFDFTNKLSLKNQFSKIKLVNESISKEAISILFTYNFHKNAKKDFGTYNNMLNYKLVDIISSIGSTKFKFSGKFIMKAIEANKDDYEWIVNIMEREFAETDETLCAQGVETEYELMDYSTNYIDDLVKLLGNVSITFELVKHPQTVAKLVNLLINEIYKKVIESEKLL